MADFMWAVKAMNNGKKVRRKSWYNGKVYLMFDKLVQNVCLSDNKDMACSMFQHDLIATDWEIYEEEKDDWNLAEFKCVSHSTTGVNAELLLVSSVKKFIELVKGDINEYQLQGCSREQINDALKDRIDKRAGEL